MSVHEPKLRALRALHGQQLSAAGAARLRRHLDGCQSCSDSLRGLRLAERLIGEVQASEPQLDFARVQAGLHARESRERRVRVLRLAAALPPAAAAAALLAIWLRPQPEVAPPAPPAPQVAQRAAPAPEPAAPEFAASVTALAGSGQLQPASGAATALRVDASLHDGDRITLASESLAHLRLDRATGCVLGPDSELLLTRVHAGETELALERGRLTSQVQPLTAAQFYRIRAAGYALSVLGTHFEVVAAADKLEVMVAEGHVLVQDGEGRVVADLHAREHFAIDREFGARLATRDASHPALQLERPRGLDVELGEWALVTLLDARALERFGVTGLSLDGSRFPMSGEIAVRVPRGDVELVVERLTALPQKAVLHVPAEGLSLAPEALRKLLRLSRPDEGRAKPIDFEQVLSVVRSGTGNLQRCYERALKQRPELDGRVTLRISIDAAGRVTQTQPLSSTAALPADLVECLRNVSERWHFPASSAPLAFDIPLRLQPR
ncbi:MAG TPA: AgmX/PglI C-terminal domain-containing protein [Polyangiales bacterium]|nr:AgmX/PglI C-terminal domain-containing protein [Polyangiales bacterium]